VSIFSFPAATAADNRSLGLPELAASASKACFISWKQTIQKQNLRYSLSDISPYLQNLVISYIEYIKR